MENLKKINKDPINIEINKSEQKPTCKTNFLKNNFIPNSTRNKNSINFHFKTPCTQKKISNQKITSNIRLNNLLISSKHSSNLNSSSKDKTSLKIPDFMKSEVKINDNLNPRKKEKISSKQIRQTSSKRDTNTSSQRTNYNSSNSYIEEYKIIINASNQNILEKMKTFSISNNIILREVRFVFN